MKFNLRNLFRPGILLPIIGVALFIDASFRLGHPPLGRATLQRDWKQNPTAVYEGYVAWGSILLGAWFARAEREIDDADSTDDTKIPSTEDSHNREL